MELLGDIFIKGLPIILAVTLHEAAHGYIALLCGDDTAQRAKRISLNPLRHIDLFGTLILPGILLLTGSPVLFGYAKPVPVNFRRLHHRRRDSIYVAAAGPAMNLFLAFVSALFLHLMVFLPLTLSPLFQEMLSLFVFINVMLAVFNMLPVPPLDGGRVAVGLLPEGLARPLARLEPYGMFIIFGTMFLSHFLGISLLGSLILPPVKLIIEGISFLTGL